MRVTSLAAAVAYAGKIWKNRLRVFERTKFPTKLRIKLSI